MRLLFVGDTHGNVDWWSRFVAPTAELNDVGLVVQVGDFGWWPHAQEFIDTVRACPVPVWFIDGNHEHWESLHETVASNPANLDGTVPMGGNLSYVPRGTLCDLSGRRVLFCGGAHSIDRRLRTPGVDRWPDEDVTDTDIERCRTHGQVDVLVCHDAPNRWDVPGISDRNPMPPVWRAELLACAAGRAQVTRIFETARPSLFVHGHYHVGYTRTLDTDCGALTVIGLDCDGGEHAFTLVDLDDLTVLPVTIGRTH